MIPINKNWRVADNHQSGKDETQKVAVVVVARRLRVHVVLGLPMTQYIFPLSKNPQLNL
jgi:hypothetical protein